MSIYDTFAQDCRALDGTETVTLTLRRAAGNTAVSVAYADVADVTAREAAGSDGLFQVGDLRFELWRSQLSGYDPRAGDEVQRADGTRWEVVDATLDDLGLAYACTARRARGSSSPAAASPAGGVVGAGAEQFAATNGSGSTFSPGAPVSVNGSGQLVLAGASGNTLHAAGLATAGAATATVETVTVNGLFTLSSWSSIAGSSSLTPGSIYYLSTTTGRLTTTRPTGSGQVVQSVGRAVSATTLAVEVGEALLIA